MNIATVIKEQRTEPDIEAFTRELSDLCRKYGVGITGSATLFVMEGDDYQLSYRAEDGSTLSLI
jgi:hypothetical protein